MRVRVRATVPFDRMSEFVRGVISPIGREADGITVEVIVIAHKGTAFSPICLNDTVAETLYSLFGTDDALEVEK